MNIMTMKQRHHIAKRKLVKHRKCRQDLTITAVKMLFVLITACTDPSPTLNPVQPIDLASLTKMVTNESFSGFLVAFAAWCPPCKEELPDLAELYLKYRSQGFRVVAMSLDSDGPPTVQPLINRLNIPFPVYWVGNNAMAAYGLIGIPTLIVIKEGKIIEKRPGRQSRRELERKIKTLIK